MKIVNDSGFTVDIVNHSINSTKYGASLIDDKLVINDISLIFSSPEISDEKLICNFLSLFSKYFSNDETLEEISRELTAIYETNKNYSSSDILTWIYNGLKIFIKDDIELDPFIVKKNKTLLKIAIENEIQIDDLKDKLTFEIAYLLNSMIIIRKLKFNINNNINLKYFYDEEYREKAVEKEINILKQILEDLDDDININPSKYKLDLP